MSGDAVADMFDKSTIDIDESFEGVPEGSSLLEDLNPEQLEQWGSWNTAPPKDDPVLSSAMYGSSTGEAVGQIGAPSLGPGVTPEDDPYIGWWGETDPEKAQSGRMTRYTTESARFILMGMTTAELEALQRQFVKAGYVQEEATYAGRATLLPTFTALIQTADINRVSWEMQIEGDTNRKAAWDAEHPNEEPGYGPFQAPDYLKPDYATLAQAAKQSTEYRLGRKPTSSEMKILTGFMGSAHRQEWEQNVYAPALGNWEKGGRAFETEEDQGSETYQGYDKDARFAEYFEDRYEGEIDHRDRTAQVQANSPSLFASIDKISRSI